jgi:uncharacterized membrane protein YeaQ/YmgE (transglycosylase-associated protein family)
MVSVMPDPMFYVIWFLFGAIIGWMSSFVTVTKSNLEMAASIIVGIIGAIIGGWFVPPLFGVVAGDEYYLIGSILLSIVGAVIMLAAAHWLTFDPEED